MRPLGSDCGAKTVASLPVFLRPLYQLRSVERVSEIVAPRRTSERTDFEVVLVGQHIVDLRDERNLCKDQFAHLVHGSLHARAVVFGEGLHREVPRALPCAIEVDLAHLGEVGKRLPLPARLDLSAEDAVPGLGQAREFVAVETVEGRSGALEHEQLLNLGSDLHALILARDGLDNADLLAVAEERVRVWLAVDGHARPAVLDDLDVCGVDVRVGLDEVVAEERGKLLGRVDGVLLGLDVDGLLLGVCGNDGTVVGLGVAGDG